MKMLKTRSDEPEMMDNPTIERKLLQKNLGELDVFNRLTGGHAITLEGIKKLVSKEKVNIIADLGCGSGDTLKFLAHWARKKSLMVKFIGVDNNIYAIQYLKRNCKGFPEINGVVMDYTEFLDSDPPVDIYLCSLFCHHLNNAKLLELLKDLKRARKGFVINDLQRSKLAYYSAWIFTRLFNGSALSKNDGPISVLRAFKRRELEQLLNQAGYTKFSIQWKWIFRFRVVVFNT